MGREPNQHDPSPGRAPDEGPAEDAIGPSAATPKAKPGDARQARLAAALRKNLQRRKSQIRGRNAAAPQSAGSPKPDDQRDS